ncbi:MAG: sugar transferase, partial [Bacteroidota bacterium]
MSRTSYRFRFIIADWLSALAAWALFYVYRKSYIENLTIDWSSYMNDNRFMTGIILLPLLWVLFYSLTGAYRNVYRRSRLRELGNTMYHSLIGVLIIFFALLLDDTVTSYKS